NERRRRAVAQLIAGMGHAGMWQEYKRREVAPLTARMRQEYKRMDRRSDRFPSLDPSQARGIMGSPMDWVFMPDSIISRSRMALSSWCCVAIARLLAGYRGLTNRLGQCGAPNCGRFNLTFVGRPRRHCSEEHADRYRRSTAAE